MIGGEHFLTPPRRLQDSMADVLARAAGEMSYFASGRDALFALLAELPHRTIHIPDLLCHSVYQACESAGKQVRSYRVGADLLAESASFAPTEDDCVLVMHYVGIPDHAMLRRARSAGTLIISDVTHMLFNESSLTAISRASDYLFGSLRKSGPFPDGGFVASLLRPGILATKPVRQSFVALRAAALLSRGFSAQDGFLDHENFWWLQTAEGLLDDSPPADHACSYLTLQLLGTVDPIAAASRIRANMEILAKMLGTACSTPCSPAHPAPYFLCLFRNGGERDSVRAQAAREQVFLPVHWDTSWSAMPSPLSDIGLSIPCDARYAGHDMQRVATLILRSLGQ